jgi:hypothetical protein
MWGFWWSFAVGNVDVDNRTTFLQSLEYHFLMLVYHRELLASSGFQRGTLPDFIRGPLHDEIPCRQGTDDADQITISLSLLDVDPLGSPVFLTDDECSFRCGDDAGLRHKKSLI